MTSAINTSDLEQQLEYALMEAELFAGTARGEVASGRASILVQQLEGVRRRTRGPLMACPIREADWLLYLRELLSQQPAKDRPRAA